MTVCKHYKNRIVPVQYRKSGGSLFEPSDNFGLFLINSGSVVLNLNGKECFLAGKIVVCTNNLDEIKLLYQSQALVEAVHFAPEFVSVSLNWDRIKGPDYEKLREKYEFPDFKFFLNARRYITAYCRWTGTAMRKSTDKLA